MMIFFFHFNQHSFYDLLSENASIFFFILNFYSFLILKMNITEEDKFISKSVLKQYLMTVNDRLVYFFMNL